MEISAEEVKLRAKVCTPIRGNEYIYHTSKVENNIEYLYTFWMW